MTVWYDTTAVFGDGDVVLRTVVVTVCVQVVLRGAAVCQWCCTNRMTHGGHHCSLDVCYRGCWVGQVRRYGPSHEVKPTQQVWFLSVDSFWVQSYVQQLVKAVYSESPDSLRCATTSSWCLACSAKHVDNVTSGEDRLKTSLRRLTTEKEQLQTSYNQLQDQFHRLRAQTQSCSDGLRRRTQSVPADGAVGVEVEGHQAFHKPFILVLTTVPPHTDPLGVSTKTKAGLVTEDDPPPF
ncbi:hypothetical protein NFI96_005950 [Prochilodus magdalenae]|nr:hypothetical protein NFI96_005950 [Prochilodus magdalenae]